MKAFTMITRHGLVDSKGNKVVSAYTLISDNYQTITMPEAELVKAIASKHISVANLDVSGNSIVSTNGALDKYTYIDNASGNVVGTPRAVVLDRVEKDGKLTGYTVFTQTGTIAELSVDYAAKLADKKLIANGKVKHTASGDIVSAIGGNYPLRTIEIAKAPKGEVTVNLVFFGKTVGAEGNYFGAIVSCTSATEMSKLNSILNTSNAKVKADVSKVASVKDTQSLAIQRFGANGVYGVFELSLLKKLVDNNAHVQNKLGSAVVSVVKYDTDGTTTEATITLDKTWKAVKSNLADEELAEKVKAYAKKIVSVFGEVKVE